MYASGFVLIFCLVGVSVAQDEFGDSASHQSVIPDDREPVRTDQTVFNPPKNEVYKKEQQVANSGCSYSGGYSTCCGWIYVPTLSYYQYTCTKFRYYHSVKTFYTWLDIGYWSYYTGQIALYHPLTRCTSVYMYYVKQWAYFCFELSNLKQTSYTVSGRALLSVYFHGVRIGYYCLGYFTVSKTAKLEDEQNTMEKSDDSLPAAASPETRQSVPPPRFRGNVMEILEEPLTAEAIESRQGVPPPGFRGNPVVMENMAEPLENNQLI